jgi:hypothetical protein
MVLKSLFKIFPVILAFSSTPLMAENATGQYETYQDGLSMTLQLQESNGQVSGTLLVEGAQYQIQGVRDGVMVKGSMSGWGETLSFSGEIQGDRFLLDMMDMNDSEGYMEPPETLVFSRTGEVGPLEAGPEPGETTGAEITINGIVLTADQLEELVRTYQVRPLPGHYWYDKYSGLYGVVGYQAFGFMLPGHQYGELSPAVSSGNSGVFVNGRHLPQVEWLIWSQILGYVIQPGRYWLDAQGNAGYEGNPIPTENLYLAAQRNAYGGPGSGGDNTWSTRFSAGNYDSGNQRGYVSVPGHGPVGYGF